MSRIAKKPIIIPSGVDFKINEQNIHVKGKKGEFNFPLHEAVVVEINSNVVTIKPKQQNHPMVGTTCKMIANFIKGVSEGFECRLALHGVGYRAKMQGNRLELSLGLSHPLTHEAPEGIKIETPSNTEIVITGADKQLVGETAAKIRAYRPPEPYKGKGVRYANEKVNLKETKKK
jgi:large subunit ribosomal protein L6